MPDIVSIGECFVELLSYDQLHADADLQMTYSGDTCNVLSMATRLGSSCGYVRKVSDAPLGEYLLQSWSNDGIDTTHVTRHGDSMSLSSHHRNPPGKAQRYSTGKVQSPVRCQ